MGRKKRPRLRRNLVSREGDRAGSLKRVWRRETLCTLEGRIARCPNTGKEESTPSERARCGYTLRQSSWQTSVGFILVRIACDMSLSRKETRAHHGRCGRVEIGRKGERVGPSQRLKVERLGPRCKTANQTRWNAFVVLHGFCLTRVRVARPRSAGKSVRHSAFSLLARGFGRVGRTKANRSEMVRSVVPADDNTNVRDRDVLGHGRVSRKNTGALGQHPRR